MTYQKTEKGEQSRLVTMTGRVGKAENEVLGAKELGELVTKLLMDRPFDGRSRKGRGSSRERLGSTRRHEQGEGRGTCEEEKRQSLAGF